MNDYKKPRTTPDIIEQAASNPKACDELMKLFDTCEADNRALYNRRLEQHLKIMAAIRQADFYPVKVARYVQQNAPVEPVSQRALKRKTLAKIEAEQEYQAQRAKQHDYRGRWKVSNAAAIETLTEHGYVRALDYSANTAITFLRSVTVAVEVPEGSGNWERRIQSKFPQLPEGEKS